MKRHRCIWLSLALLGSAWGLAAWLVIADPSTPRYRLSDGSTLELSGITAGTEHQMVDAPRWQRALYPLLPDSLRTAWGLREFTHQSRQGPEPVLWFRWHPGAPPTTTGAMRRRLPMRRHYLVARIADDRGEEQNAGAGMLEDPGRHGTSLARLPLSHHPKRASRIRLRLVEHALTGVEERTLATWSIANPISGPFPVWQPRTLPADLALPGGAARLTTIRLAPRDRSRFSRPHRLTVGYRLSPAGRPAWEPVRVELADALGYRYTPFVTWERKGAAITGAGRIHTPLWGEPLRLSTWFARPQSGSADGPVVRLRLPVIAEGEHLNLYRTHRFPGGTLTLEGVMTRGTTPLDQRPGIRSMWVQLTCPDAQLAVRVRSARDDRGQPLPTYPPDWILGGQALFVGTRSGTRSVELILSAQQTRRVDCVIAPLN